MIPPIQIARLEGFHHVAQTGGYARAARAFPYPITQPAVHQQVRKLEAELGVRLFIRAGKDRMELTAAGRHLRDFIAPFFLGLPGVTRALRRGAFGGTLTVHAAGLLVRHLLPAWSQRLRRARPDIALDLHAAGEPALDLLRAWQTDLIIDFLPDAPADVTTVRVASTWGFAVAAADHPVAARRRWTIKDLGAGTFISYPRGTAPFRLQMTALEAHGIAPPRVVSLDSADAILGFVEAGVGWSLIPWLDTVGPRSPHIVSRRLATPRAGFPVHVGFRRADADNPLIKAAVAALVTPES